MLVILKSTGELNSYELKFIANVDEAGMHFSHAVQGGICHSSRKLHAKLYNLLPND